MSAEGLAAARRYARWYIGDSTWADQIINAYNTPAETNATIDKEESR